jgi:hypothetical protein
MTKFAIGVRADERGGVWIWPYVDYPYENDSVISSPEYYSLPALGLMVIVDDNPAVNTRLNNLLDMLMVENPLHLHGNAIIAARSGEDYIELAPQVIAELVGMALWPRPKEEQ